MSPITRNSTATGAVGLRRSLRLKSKVVSGSQSMAPSWKRRSKSEVLSVKGKGKYNAPSSKIKMRELSEVLNVKEKGASKVPSSKSRALSGVPIVELIAAWQRAPHIIVVLEGPHTEILPVDACEDFGKPTQVPVNPKLTVGTLRKLLKPDLRIPEWDDILLLAPDAQTPRLLEDHLTLNQCGVKFGDTLLVCRDSPLFIHVLHNQLRAICPVELSSCFATVAHVKKEIAFSTRWPAENQIITTMDSETPLEDSTTMASLRIFRPYSCQMMLPSPSLRVKFVP